MGGWICIEGVFVMISLSGLHSWMWILRCGITRFGRTYLRSLDCGVFKVSKSFVFMDCCFVCCTSLVISSKLWSYMILSGLRIWVWGSHFVYVV